MMIQVSDVQSKHIKCEQDQAVIDHIYRVLSERHATDLLASIDQILNMSVLKHCLNNHPALVSDSFSSIEKQAVLRREIGLIKKLPAYRAWIVREKYQSINVNLYSGQIEQLANLTDTYIKYSDKYIEALLVSLSGWELTYLGKLLVVYLSHKQVPGDFLSNCLEAAKALAIRFRAPPEAMSSFIRSGAHCFGWDFLQLVQHGQTSDLTDFVELGDLYKSAIEILLPKKAYDSAMCKKIVECWMVSPQLRQSRLKHSHHWLLTFTQVVAWCDVLLSKPVEDTIAAFINFTQTELWAVRRMLQFVVNQYGASTLGGEGERLYEFLMQFKSHVFSQQSSYMGAWCQLLDSGHWYALSRDTVLKNCVDRSGVFKTIPKKDEGLGRSHTPSPPTLS